MYSEQRLASAASSREVLINQTHNFIADTIDPLHSTGVQPEAATLFSVDHYNDDLSAIATARSRFAPARLSFQETNIENRRIDMSSVAGQRLQEGRATFEESAMNPDGHFVINLPLGNNHDDSILQVAINRNHIEPSPEQIQLIQEAWQHQKSQFDIGLTALKSLAAESPNGSIADLLSLDSPTSPNAFIVSWDISNSTKSVNESYGEFRSFVARFGEEIVDITHRHCGKIMSATGDGQNAYLPINPENGTRLSKEKLAEFGRVAVSPYVEELTTLSREVDDYNLRFTAGFGRVEKISGGLISPQLFNLNALSKQQPRDRFSFELDENTKNIINSDSI